MNQRAVGTVWVAGALVLGLVAPAPCADRPPAGAVPSTARATPAPPAGDLPSTVSPAIARFMQEAGRNLATPEPPPAPAAAVARPPVLPSGAVTSPAERAPEAARPAAALEPPPPAPDRAPAPLPAPSPGRTLVTAGPAAEELKLTLKPSPLEATDFRFPLSLASALQLADARPLIVAAAQAGVWVAEAQLTRAKVLWIPTFVYGVDYLRHDGGGPDFNKGIMTAPTVNYFMTGPGATLYVNLTDAYFQPLIQRQVLNARHWDTQSAKNDAVFQTADAYFRVHQYRGMYAGGLYTVEWGKELVDRIAHLSMELVPKVEVDRARNMLADLEQRTVMYRQEWRVASADLTQVLRLDPRAIVVPLENDHAQITLIDPGRSLDELMPIALANRPELSARTAIVQAAETGVRREKMRPVLPIVQYGGFQTPTMYPQAGLFALGPNSSLNQFRGRADFNVQFMWQLEAFGIGNLARIKNQRGMQSQAIIDLRNAQDMVAADVTRALARVQSAAARVLQADRALRTGLITFHGHLEGLEQTRRLENVLVLTFRPQEAVYSLDMLNIAFNEYFGTVAEYNRAQFDLFHALGYPASEVTRMRPVGDVQPVDTVRPPYLPPVGNGPPPATR